MVEETDDWRKALWDEANRVRIDTIYSGRGHQVVAQRWSLISKLVGLPAAILSAILSSTAALTALLGKDKTTTATLALIAAALVAARAFLRPEELADSHGLKGNECMNVASDATHFQDVSLKMTADPEKLKSKLDELAARRNSLRLRPPRYIPRWAYEQAKKGIAVGESDYENDHLWRPWER